MIELEMDLCRPQLELELAAERESLPLVRQSLRALAELAEVEAGATHDAELALTEACANAVRHAYRGGGRIEVTLELHQDTLLATVRDHGQGMPLQMRRVLRGGREFGLGLTVIEGIASELDIRSDRHGTEVAMALPFPVRWPEDDPRSTPTSSLAHVVRRLVAMVAAQADMTPDRIVEALLVAELVVSNAREELAGECLTVSLSRLPNGLELRVGPLEPGGAAAALRRAEVPVLGSVVDRLVDGLWTETQDETGPEPGERLAARFGRVALGA